MKATESTTSSTTRSSILTRTRRKNAAVPEPPERDPRLGDRSPEWAVHHFLTLSKADFDARYGVTGKARVKLDNGKTSERFIGRRPNLLCVKDPDTLVPAADERLLRKLLGKPAEG